MPSKAVVWLVGWGGGVDRTERAATLLPYMYTSIVLWFCIWVKLVLISQVFPCDSVCGIEKREDLYVLYFRNCAMIC